MEKQMENEMDTGIISWDDRHLSLEEVPKPQTPKGSLELRDPHLVYGGHDVTHVVELRSRGGVLVATLRAVLSLGFRALV